MAIRIRQTRTLDEYFDATGAISHYFGAGSSGADRVLERAERFARMLPLDRTHAAFDGPEIVGGAGAFPFQLTVPGGPVECAGVTVVGVLPTHRRRGILSRLMRAQLDDVRERGEPIAALWASEETIYGRYGYGLASLCQVDMRLPRAYARLADPTPDGGARVRLVPEEEATSAFPRIYERVRRRSVGFVSRTPAWWELRQLNDSAERRGSRGWLNRALLELDGKPAGYALYRLKGQFEGAVNTGQVQVAEAFGDSPRATREIWRFLLSIDWLSELRADMLPFDHPLVHLVANPNRMVWKVADGIWVRLVDVGAALSARSYATDGRVTFELADSFLPDNAGTWTLDGGVAKRSRRRPDMRLDAQALASAYLGGFTFAALAAAGRVEEASRGGIARADALFRTDRLPWCPENF